MNYEFEVVCISCKETVKTPFWKEANKTEWVGCQVCRLTKTLEQASAETFMAIEDWMIRSGQETIFKRALKNYGKSKIPPSSS